MFLGKSSKITTSNANAIALDTKSIHAAPKKINRARTGTSYVVPPLDQLTNIESTLS
jgi:hypothetical protein